MNFKGVIIFFTALSLLFFAQIQRGFCKQVEGVPLPSEKKEVLKQSLLSLPLYFIKNQGQLQEEVLFYVKGQEKSTYFTKDGINIVLASKEENQEKGKDKLDLGRAEREEERAKEDKVIVEAIKLVPMGMREGVEVVGEEETPGKVNYFIGNDPSKWRTGIPTYSKVRYKVVYEGVDLVFYGNERELEYDVVVEPGRDYSSIVFRVEGAKELRKAEDGSLEIVLSSGSRIIQRKPNVYQEIGGERRELEGEFEVSKEEAGYLYSFKVRDWDRSYALIIDPVVLSYSTYFGGNNYEDAYAITSDNSGNVYIAGWTQSEDLPVKNAFDSSYNGSGGDVFVAKFNTTLTGANSLVYSTYLGGSSSEVPYGIAIDSDGNVYVAGSTSSNDFPTTSNAFQRSLKGEGDAFLSKLSSNGNSLLYSTYFGGNADEQARAIAGDSNGFIYITGRVWSTDFPIKNAYQSSHAGGDIDAFISKFNTNSIGQNSLVYSTFLGGSGGDDAYGISVDNSGNAYVTGYTTSSDFPTKNSFKDSHIGASDIFVTKINTNQSGVNGLLYSSYFGGSNYDFGYGIVADSFGNVYVTGETWSYDFFVKNPYQSVNAGGSDTFIMKINTTQAGDKSLVYSTYFGGSANDFGYAIAIDSKGYAYLTGYTKSKDFPVKYALKATCRVNPYTEECIDIFISKFNQSGTGIVYSTYFGGTDSDIANGIVVDTLGNIYVAGTTYSNDFPLKNAFQNTLKFYSDAFIVKITEFTSLLNLIKPNGGEKWNAGLKYVVKWEAPLNSYKFNLRYSTDNKTTWTNIATVLASNRCTSDGTKHICTYVWTIPAQDGRKPQSFVRVRAFDSSNQVIGTDDSDKAFAIEVLKLTSPNGGETLKVGSTHNITWETYALTKTVAKVQLQYSTNGGSSWTNIKTLTGNPGQYNWTVPNTPSTNCKVRVILKDSTGAEIARDVSDKVFTIQQ